MKTPQQTYPKLAEKLGLDEVYLKREDLHKYKSHKGRSLPLMVKRAAKEGATSFVISSSGNAALAAALAVENHNRNNPGSEIRLTIYVGKKINEKKLRMLTQCTADERILIEQVERPKQAAFQQEKNKATKLLRQSTDDTALEGYTGLAEELIKIPGLQAVFVPTSSGTTAAALINYFHINNKPIEVHIVQTTSCHPIAAAFDKADHEEISIADAIVDNVAHRKAAVVDGVIATGGHGWIVDNQSITAAQKLVQATTKLHISPNAALSVAGLHRAMQNGWTWSGPVVCLITGA